MLYVGLIFSTFGFRNSKITGKILDYLDTLDLAVEKLPSLHRLLKKIFYQASECGLSSKMFSSTCKIDGLQLDIA